MIPQGRNTLYTKSSQHIVAQGIWMARLPCLGVRNRDVMDTARMERWEGAGQGPDYLGLAYTGGSSASPRSILGSFGGRNRWI